MNGSSGNTKRVDVVAVMVSLASHGGKIVSHYNTPRPTGTVKSWCRPAKTPVVLRALRSAEKAGLVECVGTGAQHNGSYNASAASLAEFYWRLTPAAIAARVSQ